MNLESLADIQGFNRLYSIATKLYFRRPLCATVASIRNGPESKEDRIQMRRRPSCYPCQLADAAFFHTGQPTVALTPVSVLEKDSGGSSTLGLIPSRWSSAFEG